MINAINLANSIRNKLELLIKGGYETEITLIKKKGNIEQLGISDIGENKNAEEYKINIVRIIRGSDKNTIGEVKNNMELGNNPDTYLEFIRIFSFDDKAEDSKQIVEVKTGATHMVESRLLAIATPRGSSADEVGMNLGDLIAMADVKAVISIKSIDGNPIKPPHDLATLYEIMGEFTYDEWDEFKIAVQPNAEKLKEKAKNLQTSTGLDNV